MKAFEDAKGRTWPINITVSASRRIRDLAGIDFGNPNTLADGDTLTRLSTDMVLLADVLYAALLPDLTAKNITKEDFCDNIYGDTLNTAIFALLEAVSDFFPKAQGNLLKRVLQSARETQEKMAGQAMEELEKALTPADSQTNSRESAG
ncbi:MAG: hypothetical protein IJT83_14730 [Victivallales bacterium]|nr:hypothetical protein [Victivallales bacterium]